MKKIKVILACIVAAAVLSGCSTETKKPSEPTSPASETSQTSAPPAADQQSAASTSDTASSESSEAAEDEYITVNASIKSLKEQAPHLYEYSRYFMQSTGTIEMDTLDDSFNVLAHTVIYINREHGMRVYVETAATGETSDIRLDNEHNYIISHAQKKVVDVEPGYITLVAMDETIRKTHLGYTFADREKITVETGEEEINGVMYDYERLTDGTETTTFYSEKETGIMKYMRMKSGLVAITNYTYDVAEDAFDIPADYEIVKATEQSE